MLGCKVKVACSLCLSPAGTSARNREKQATQLSCKARASACINRIYKKNLADPLQLLNFVLGQCLQRQLAGACIAAKSPSRTVTDVAAELVQQDYQGQAAVQWLFPRRQPALQRLLSSLAKACAYFLVERGAARKPAFVQVA